MSKDKPISQEAHIHYGICGRNLFMQIATYHDHILWEGKVELSEKPKTEEIENSIPKLFETFKESGIKLSKSGTYHIDGLRIIETGKMHTKLTKKVESIYLYFWDNAVNHLFWSK